MRQVAALAAVLVGGAFLAATCGRILLPSMGLNPPSYWSWLGATFVAMLGVYGVKAITAWGRR